MNGMTTIPGILRNLLLLMELDPEGVRARLKEARKQAGFTQEQIAEILHVHKGTVENDEGRGVAKNATWGRLNQYAGLYNRPVEWLLWGDDVIVHDRASSEQLEALVGRLEAFAEKLAPLEAALGDGQPARPRGRAPRSRAVAR